MSSAQAKRACWFTALSVSISRIVCIGRPFDVGMPKVAEQARAMLKGNGNLPSYNPNFNTCMILSGQAWSRVGMSFAGRGHMSLEPLFAPDLLTALRRGSPSTLLGAGSLPVAGSFRLL